MNINLKFRPVRVTGSSRSTVMSAISGGHVYTMGSNGIYLAPYPGRDSGTIRVYNLEKHRKKVEIVLNRKTKKPSRRVVTPAHWVGHYYDLPLDLLRTAGLKVNQHTRYFEITAKNSKI
jgi:hypothetical protein